MPALYPGIINIRIFIFCEVFSKKYSIKQKILDSSMLLDTAQNNFPSGIPENRKIANVLSFDSN